MDALLDRSIGAKILRTQSLHCLDSRADFSKTIGELVEAAHFGLVDPHITLPGYFRGFRDHLSKEILVVTFDQAVNYDEAIAALDNAMLRPAELPELLALAICYPEEQVRGGQILGLGSVAQGYVDLVTGEHDFGARFVPGLSWSKELNRSLVPYGCAKDRKWPANCRFAAVSLKN